MKEEFRKPKKWDDNPIEEYLINMADSLEPTTHCCECTPGSHFEKHMVHIQYQDCTCKKEDFVLNKNE